MKRATLWKASVVTTAEAEDAVAERLAAHFAPRPSSYTDVETGHTTVSAYTSTRPKQIPSVKRALRSGLNEIKACGLNLGPAIITIQRLPRKNWAESWKSHFKPIEIGKRLLVKPSWIRRSPERGQVVIVLDPGLSFGTGQHPTTEFCLRELVKRHDGARQQSLLDIGTGSGILAIAAAKLGYAPVHAFDYDPQSVLVAKENARKNRVADQVKVTRADLTKLPRRSSQQYDMVCANLLANILIAERDRILARVKSDGVLVVAGILKREFREVRRAYEADGCRLVASKSRKEWCSGTFFART
ncbi:MAG TPA: 50S ribosomal protein L11 methyltransferase [Verrucomicrobiae bacterium]|nr:50S ribosomal protein L11 methyltransferase [Verrucomicrobiae bacterium]